MTTAAATGVTNLSALSHLHQHRRPLLMPRVKCIKQTCHCTCHTTKRPTTTHPASDDNDSDDEVAELRAKDAQRRARRRAASARYRARHPERVAAQRRRSQARYRANHPDRIAAQKRRYRAKRQTNSSNDDDDDEWAKLRARQARRRASQARYRARHSDRIAAYQQRYYQTNKAWIQRYQRQYHQSERGRAWWLQYEAKRQQFAALGRPRGQTERERTAEKLQALGPLTLTVRLEDFMQDFWDSVDKDLLSPRASEAMTITDMDSGDLHPLDSSACDESSLSSCDMWDDGRGFLDNLLEELRDLPSPSDNSLCDLSSSDDSLYGLLSSVGPWSPQDSCFDLEDFVT